MFHAGKLFFWGGGLGQKLFLLERFHCDSIGFWQFLKEVDISTYDNMCLAQKYWVIQDSQDDFSNLDKIDLEDYEEIEKDFLFVSVFFIDLFLENASFNGNRRLNLC